MGIMDFRGNAARKEPPLQAPDDEDVSDDTKQWIDRQKKIERHRDQLLRQVEQLEGQMIEMANLHRSQVTLLDTQVNALRGELELAEAKRDFATNRAIAARTALKIASKIIIDAHDEGEIEAAASQTNEPRRGREGATDLDEGIKSILQNGVTESRAAE